MIKSVKYFEYSIWIVIALSIGLTIYCTWCGIGLTYDSFDYLAAASSFQKDSILRNHNGSPYFFHAPLFPVLLSLLGENPLVKIKVINLLLFLMTLLTIQQIIDRHFTHRWLNVMCLFAIGFGVGQQMIYNFVWTEPSFLFLFALHNLFLIKYLKRHRKQELVWLILMAFLMGITRNAGFFILFSTAIVLFLYRKEKENYSIVFYLFIGSSGFVLWNLYAFFILNGFDGILNDDAFFSGYWINLINYLDIFLQWIFPSIIPIVLRLVFLLSFFIISLKLINARNFAFLTKVFFTQFLIYTFIMIFFVEVDKSEIERLLAIVYPWFIVGLLLLIDQFWHKLNRSVKRIFQICLVVWLIYVGGRSIKNSIMWHQNHCQESLSTKIEKDKD